ncbi:MAG TPA: hypothetical protein VGH19_02580 [Verrucomicrobiae bacterium]
MKETGDLIYRKQTTGKLLFKREGEGAFIDFGNVRMYKYAPKIERTKTTVARKGYVQLVEERPTQVEHRWTVGLDEELPDLVRLHLLAGTGATVTQSTTAVPAHAVLNVKKGQVIVLPDQNVTVTSVKIDEEEDVTTVPNVDYKVDAVAGTITILHSGQIADGDDLLVAYTPTAATFTEHTGLTDLCVKGTVVFDEYDQHQEAPRARYTFTAQITVSNGGDNDGKKQSEFEVELLATGKIVRRGRVDA